MYNELKFDYDYRISNNNIKDNQPVVTFKISKWKKTSETYAYGPWDIHIGTIIRLVQWVGYLMVPQ